MIRPFITFSIFFIENLQIILLQYQINQINFLFNQFMCIRIFSDTVTFGDIRDNMYKRLCNWFIFYKVFTRKNYSYTDYS